MSSATRSGLFFGALQFLANASIGIFLPICAPLCALFWGVATGVVAVYWDDGSHKRRPAEIGARAGVISAVGAYLGLLAGMIFSYSVMGGQEQAVELASQYLGGGMNSPDLLAFQWVGVLLASCCLGLLNAGFLAGLAALAAHLYDRNWRPS